MHTCHDRLLAIVDLLVQRVMIHAPLLRRYSFSIWFMISFFLCVCADGPWYLVSAMQAIQDFTHIYVNHDQQANSFSRHYACLNHDNKDFHTGDLFIYIPANHDQNFVWKCTLCLRICSMREKHDLSEKQYI